MTAYPSYTEISLYRTGDSEIIKHKYTTLASIVALADLKASTPVAVVVKEKQNHF